MDTPSPITVAIARFEDLLALGLRAVLADDPNLSVVAQDIEYDRIPVMLQAHRPDVLILDVDAIIDIAIVRELSAAHPDTNLVLLGDGLSALESAQLLAFAPARVSGRRRRRATCATRSTLRPAACRSCRAARTPGRSTVAS